MLARRATDEQAGRARFAAPPTLATFVVRRLLWIPPTLLGVSLVAFALVHLAPGDPAELVLAGGAAGEVGPAAGSEDALARFRAEHLLDAPLWKQYLHYVGPFDLSARGPAWLGGSGETPWHGLLVLDLGRELRRPDVRVADELARRLWVTVPLAALASALAYLLALPIGIASAVRRGSALDVTTTLLLFALHALPVFFAGVLLQYAFGATGLGWLPALGLADPDAADMSPWRARLDLARHLVLPVACFAYASLAYLSRQMRTGVLEALSGEYVRTARAKGLTERAVVLRHVLRNSMIPVLTLFASVLPLLVGGSIVVEVVFDLPGMGRYAYESLLGREYDAVMATTLCAALMTILGVLFADVAYALVDPRIRSL